MINFNGSPEGNALFGSDCCARFPCAQVYHTRKDPKLMLFLRNAECLVFPSKHNARMQALRSGVVLTNGNKLLIGIAHLHVFSIGPVAFRNAHLSSVIGPPDVFSA